MRIIQFLNWDINSIIDYLDYVKEQNFDTIQINPVQPFIDVEGYEWWATYQPLDFKIGNIYGTKDDLTKLCEEAKKRGINIIVDVITNHLANNGLGQETVPNVKVNEKIKNNKDCWKIHNKVNEFNSYRDVIEGSIGLPGLNLKNKKLQKIILNFLEDLKDCGVSGFRFDAAKHIGLPSDSVDYFEKVKEFLDKNNLIAYAEFLDGPNNVGSETRNLIYNKKNEFANYMYVLTEEDSLVDNTSKKVTFVESHDTYLNTYGSTQNINVEEIIDKYVELTKKYENTLFYVRDNSKGKKIFTENPDRAIYADKSWICNEKLKLANLNKGNELKNLESIINERKECEYMNKNEKSMDLHHELSMKIHEILLNQLGENSSVREYVNMTLLDYNIQMILNSLLGVTPYDDFLINCIMGEFYKEKWNKKPLNKISYPEFCKQVLCYNRK